MTPFFDPSCHFPATHTVDHRQRLAKKAHKKFKNLVNDQASEQIEMAGVRPSYLSFGPTLSELILGSYLCSVALF